MKNLRQHVALLATGNEIIQGDILNTNSQQISLRLSEHNIPVGMHMTASDEVNEIECAIKFLLQTYQGLIITGGLGPTSDDITRYALSTVLNRALVFHQPTWEEICQRLKRFGYDHPPESNRQQALFPEGATIIPNLNGTAAGCKIEVNGQPIFMLPGPPAECLPMVDSTVVPVLTSAYFHQKYFRQNWLLFGVSEGKIAEELDLAVKPFAVTTGYRLCYPYLEFKLSAHQQSELARSILVIEPIIKPYLIGNGKQSASEQLKHLLKQSKQRLGVCDLATGGLLETCIKNPATAGHLLFSTHLADLETIPHLLITGLEEFWHQQSDIFQTHLKLLFQNHTHVKTVEATIPFRGERVKAYAVEWVCQQLFQIMKFDQTNHNLNQD
jgi:nicotinamide-nucleotide amidase